MHVQRNELLGYSEIDQHLDWAAARRRHRLALKANPKLLRYLPVQHWPRPPGHPSRTHVPRVKQCIVRLASFRQHQRLQ
ncbi:hypothetical protein Ct61P_11709 [Colletotrichum tofieldiae]|nr:hypothetical protein Ct61P_11709 [Colletotrichum tofieldiae]